MFENRALQKAVPRAVAPYPAIMEQVIALSTQNPLSLLVKFGIMAWNNSCGTENCSGHGECHNGTCLCEVRLALCTIIVPLSRAWLHQCLFSFKPDLNMYLYLSFDK